MIVVHWSVLVGMVGSAAALAFLLGEGIGWHRGRNSLR